MFANIFIVKKNNNNKKNSKHTKYKGLLLMHNMQKFYKEAVQKYLYKHFSNFKCLFHKQFGTIIPANMECLKKETETTSCKDKKQKHCILIKLSK